VVFVTHEITPVAGFVDRVLYVAGGHWAAGTPDEVMTTQRLSALYGTHIDVIRVHGRILVVGGDDPAGHHHLPGADRTGRAGSGGQGSR
jgi:zinc/manganese transport system ATP-binding protein